MNIKRLNFLIKNLSKNQRGFSLVEIMVAAGLLGALSLGVMQMNKSMFKGQATAEVNMEGIEIRRQIVSNMTDKQACENTLVGTNLGGTVSSIKNTSNANLFVVGTKYGSNTLQLQSIKVVDLGDLGSGMRDAELRVVFKSLKKTAYGTAQKAFKSRLKVKAANATAPITECFDDTSGVVATANATTCIALSGVWDAATSTCTVSHFVRKAGDDMSGKLTTPQIISAQFCTGTNCKAIGDLALSNQTCPNGQVADGVNSDGTVKCKALQCPANQFFAGLDSSGNSICRPYPTNTCPTNQYVKEVRPDGTVLCATLPVGVSVLGRSCQPNFYLTGFDGNGTPICGRPVKMKLCPAGQFVTKIHFNGDVDCGGGGGCVPQVRVAATLTCTGNGTDGYNGTYGTKNASGTWANAVSINSGWDTSCCKTARIAVYGEGSSTEYDTVCVASWRGTTSKIEVRCKP